MPLRPTSELVGIGWIKSLPGITPANVASRLPQSTDAWAATGFTVVSVVGTGSGSQFSRSSSAGLRWPVFSVDCWAVNPGSGKPPYGKANQLAEVIRLAAEERSGQTPKLITDFPGDYMDARVLSAHMPADEPRRIPNDDGSYAHYVFELALAWVAVP